MNTDIMSREEWKKFNEFMKSNGWSIFILFMRGTKWKKDDISIINDVSGWHWNKTLISQEEVFNRVGYNIKK